MLPVSVLKTCMLHIILALEAVGLLLCCAAPASATSVDGDVWLLTGRSQVLIKVYRAGPLAWLGHNHVIEPLSLSGKIRAMPALNAEVSADLRALRVDDPAARQLAGKAFAVQPDAQAIAGTSANLLGERGLDVARYPLASLQVRGGRLVEGRQTLAVKVTLHGVTRSYSVPVSLTRSARGWRARGQWQLKQSDFDVVPFSLFGGALRVRDQVDIKFSLYAEPG